MKLEKITQRESGPSTGRRWYDDACGAAHGLELVGERWSLLIVRELLFGPRRFSDIRAGLPGLSANVLSQRLETLEGHGLVVHFRLPPPASVQVYGLTEWGLAADEVVMALGRWAIRSPDHDPTLPLSNASLMLSFRTLFLSEQAGDTTVTVGFRLGEDRFRVRVADGRLEARRVETADGDIVLSGSAGAVADFVYDGAPPLRPAEASVVAVEGDPDAAVRFRRCFRLPDRLGVPG